jgi:hypothetical protein
VLIFLYGLILPNQCKKCELINKQNGDVLFTNEGCGSENTHLEEEAQVKAYEMVEVFTIYAIWK